jgi:hypothetical protein
MKFIHRLLGHRQVVHESKLINHRDYCFCSCGAVFNP